MTRRRRHLDRPPAFTLIEVLVVVAIIALLIAILMPSLARVRMQAKSAVCLSNLRQIGAGMMMYLGDHDGWLPVGPADKLWYVDEDNKIQETHIPQSNWTPFPWSNCHWGGRRAGYNHDWTHNPPIPEIEKAPLTHYLYPGAGLDVDTPLFRCPGDDGSERWQPLGTRQSYYDLCGNSYNIYPWRDRGSVVERRLRNPSVIVVTSDGSMYTGVRQEQQVPSWHGPFSKHNMLFLDFHAESKHVDTRSHEGPGWRAEFYFNIMKHYYY